MNIYVGNLPYSTDEEALGSLFSEYGDVQSVKLVIDRQTGRSRGFGFVEMDDDSAAQAAIDATHGMDMGGRSLVVNEAKPREERPRRSNNGGGGYNRNRY